jgi:membrane AbrB-like protein
VVSGALASWVALPLPWMLGPLVAMAIAKILGVQLEAPQGGRQVGQLIIGCALGLYFTPVVTEAILLHADLMLLAAALTIVLGYVCGFFLARASGVDMTSALFASTPGGASEMAVLGERYGARLDKVALAQSMRILLVVVTIPAILTYSGASRYSCCSRTRAGGRYPGSTRRTPGCWGRCS